MDATHQNKGKIAIIGGGISGLTAGWLLSRKGDYDVTLYEAMDGNGLDGFALNVAANHPIFENPKDLRIDVPFRYHVPNIYANLTQMCRVLGVKTQQYEQDIILYDKNENFLFGYSTLHLAGHSMPLPYLRNFVTPTFYSYMWQFYWFRKQSWEDWQQGKLKGKTFQQYLKEKAIPSHFSENFLLNYLSLVHTCTYETLREYPAALLVKFLHDMTSGYGLWKFTHGTKDVAERLLEPEQFKLCPNTRITKLEKQQGGVKVFFPDGKSEVFDDVILATQPNVATKIIDSIPELDEPKKHLQKFPVVTSTMAIHTDISILPTKKSPVSKNVLQSMTDSCLAHKILNKNYDSLNGMKTTVIQTWSMEKCPAEAKTVISESRMNRQIHTLDSLDAADKIVELQGKHRVWFCGGYTLHTSTFLSFLFLFFSLSPPHLFVFEISPAN
eukprot:TRINITY_DN4631_c0_g1_i3.p1 TRINITY_DN4631_c0_g1~~TRINITY_DN4631_c0_g1_i3.p1  ORF type:complete len:459 (-),score=88.60 TRINITY_DN4631_c0_g1_i3:209-1531(-)